ncbi:unnamed protein product, partial [Choristocarpus tenellus]
FRCYLLFLPKYSPDLNPIEHCWANFKNLEKLLINILTFLLLLL